MLLPVTDWTSGTAALAPSSVHATAARSAQTLLSFVPLPLGPVVPSGCLRNEPMAQANGLTGFLDEVWLDAGPNRGHHTKRRNRTLSASGMRETASHAEMPTFHPFDPDLDVSVAHVSVRAVPETDSA